MQIIYENCRKFYEKCNKNILRPIAFAIMTSNSSRMDVHSNMHKIMLFSNITSRLIEEVTNIPK